MRACFLEINIVWTFFQVGLFQQLSAGEQFVFSADGDGFKVRRARRISFLRQSANRIVNRAGTGNRHLTDDLMASVALYFAGSEGRVGK
jgi:hypothetical protein